MMMMMMMMMMMTSKRRFDWCETPTLHTPPPPPPSSSSLLLPPLKVSITQLETFKLPVRKWLTLPDLNLNISIRDGSHKTAADILSQPDLTLEQMEELMVSQGVEGE